MKKLMTAFAAVAMATVCSAANYTWGVSDIDPLDKDGNYLCGGDATCYVLLGTVKQTAVDGGYNLDFSGVTAILNYNSGYEDPDMTDSWWFGQPVDYTASGDDPRLAVSGDPYSVLFLMGENNYDLDGLKAYEGDYVLTTDTSKRGYDGASGDEWAKLMMPAVDDTSWKTAVAVPEPTSGLLLLLGMAGLALRRRRA